MIKNYISAPEVAKKWGISELRVQKLCEENRIPDDIRSRRMWLLLKEAEKPKDSHKKL
ncbi:DNA-binding protein [Clostridioides sp. ZZV15-6388]|uniref:DNA-binding protein n=1 Tax=Clostridioides sp. ZZV15-6388 TaxID=2811499 RepID=UPI001D10327E|nr:DNA-binding protein [Clostridioides sp. ZZV15-6388]